MDVLAVLCSAGVAGMLWMGIVVTVTLVGAYGASEFRKVLRVEDNGPGFPPHVLPRLFETFFTTKGPEKGTGLGLALSRELVDQSGGTLVAENREEGGARLRLELPAGGLPGSAS